MTRSDRREAPSATERRARTTVPERLEAIVLAAGAGSRFGGGKLTAPWRGGRLIDGALTVALGAPVRSVTVVLGADPGVRDAAETLAAGLGRLARLRLVEAADHAEGMGASLRAGVRALPPDCAGVFVFLGDMPLIPPGLPAALAAALAHGVLAVAPTFDGRRGHPVLFATELLPALATAQGDEGARAVLSGLGERLARVPSDSAGVLIDVDRPGDMPAG